MRKFLHFGTGLCFKYMAAPTIALTSATTPRFFQPARLGLKCAGSAISTLTEFAELETTAATSPLSHIRQFIARSAASAGVRLNSLFGAVWPFSNSRTGSAAPLVTRYAKSLHSGSSLSASCPFRFAVSAAAKPSTAKNRHAGWYLFRSEDCLLETQKGWFSNQTADVRQVINRPLRSGFGEAKCPPVVRVSVLHVVFRIETKLADYVLRFLD